MAKLSTFLLVSLLLYTQHTQSTPIPDPGFGSICFDCLYTHEDQYSNLTSQVIESAPRLVSGAACTSYQGATCYQAYSQTHIVTVTASCSVGAFIDFPLVKGMLHLDVVVSTGTAKAVTVTEVCPAGLTCGMTMQETLLKVNGNKQDVPVFPRCGKAGPVISFTAYYPVIIPNAAKDNQAVVKYASCTAQNMPKDPTGQLLPCPDLPDPKAPISPG